MTNFLKYFKSIPRPFLLAVLSGLLIGTSYIPFTGWALFFCYSPLWIGLLGLLKNSTENKKLYFHAFWAAWVTQFILTLIGFNWIFYVSSEFGLLHWSVSAAALILFAALMHLHIPIAMVSAVFLIKKFKIEQTLIRLLVMALCLSLLERIWPSIFEWNLAYSLLWMKLPLYQWADVVGFWGLSTWIFVFQAFITASFMTFKINQEKAIVIGLVALFSLIALITSGNLKQKKWSHFDQSVNVGLVQGNVGNIEKIQSEKSANFQSYILNIYVRLTTELLKQKPETEILIWPETAMPFPLDSYFFNRPEQNELLNSVQVWNKPVFTGGYSVDLKKRDHLGNSLMSNSIFYIGPQRQLLGEVYNKTDLLVFGEYMPLGEQLPFLYKLLPFVGIYKVGPGPSPQKIEMGHQGITWGPQICYESLNPGFSRGLAKKGAQIIFNVTNDSWFGWWAEPFQHEYMTLARAIEVRRPLVRATNTGVSSIILANGDILTHSPLNQTWAETFKVQYLEKPEQTFYTSYGHLDWILWIFVLIFLLMFFKNKGIYVRD